MGDTVLNDPDAMRARRCIGFVAFVAAIMTLSARLRSRRRRRADLAVSSHSRTHRSLEIGALATRVAGDTAMTKARQAFASAPRRAVLQRDLEMRSAQAVADRLGNMKGALMKLGQMASYIDDGMPEHMRAALAELQGSAPPMSAELAARVIEEELGRPPDQVFATWDPEPLASASIGQVHRAITHDGQAVAVKVQYPGVAEAIAADLGTADLVFAALGAGFKGLDHRAVTTEIKARLLEELDYCIEADNQRLFHRSYDGHPNIHVPGVIDVLSTARVLTSELALGSSLQEVKTWSGEQRNLAAECVFRFVFRSLYGLHAFNGDPHPGNYLFRPDGQVTFVDFGMVRRFDHTEVASFLALIDAMVVNHDPAAFRAGLITAGFLPDGVPATDAEIVEYFGAFYDIVRHGGPFTFSPEYASSIVRRTFDLSSPIAKYATVPAAYVVIQRINLGLFAILGSLNATANWRSISEEIWPMTAGPPSTPMGAAEHAWLAARTPNR